MRDRISPFIENSVKLYGALLYLYPADHREEYGWLMVQLFRDKAYDAYKQDGDVGIILHWLATLLDLIISVLNERREKGFTMSFNFLGKIRSPMLMLAGILLTLSAYSNLKPAPWYIERPLYDAAEALFVPAMVIFGLGLTGLLIAGHRAMAKIAQLALIGTILASLGIGLVAIVERIIAISYWSENGWTFFVILMLTFMICLLIFSISMIRKGYRQMIWLLIHPVWMLTMYVVQLTREFLGQTNYSEGPFWAMFFMIASMGIAWFIAGYLLRIDFHKAKATVKQPFIRKQSVQEASS